MASIQEHYSERLSSRTKKLLAVCATALLVGTALAVPALALPSGPGVREGKNIAVFHNIDFIAAFGYNVGEQLTVQVFRSGVEIGSASGPAVEVDEGLPKNGALEVNHGPEGAPQPGDCWTGTTPDILPGDRVVVTGDGGKDVVLVDDIAITKKPTDRTSTADKTDVIVEGHASYADGTPIPIAALDSAEIRQGEPRFRATPNFIQRIPGTKDGWRAIYRHPYKIFQIKEPLTIAQQKRAVLRGDHAMGYGHVAPLPLETQLVEGFGNPNGPALGCESLAPAESYAVKSSSHKAVNIANVGRDLVVRGLSQDASRVSVKLNDNNPTTDPLTATATLVGDGAQSWTVTFPSGKAVGVRGVADLKDGTLTASGRYTLAGGTISGVTLKIRKDTVAPNAPKSSLEPGVYQRAKSVTLKTGGTNKIHYTQSGSRPSATSKVFTRPIRVTGTQTIKAIAVDQAGNKSPIASFRYVIR